MTMAVTVLMRGGSYRFIHIIMLSVCHVKVCINVGECQILHLDLRTLTVLVTNAVTMASLTFVFDMDYGYDNVYQSMRICRVSRNF